MRRGIALILFTWPLGNAQVTVTGLEGDCGFSKLQPRRLSHFVERAVIAKVPPQYPPAAKANGVTGTVRVKILVNKRGLVERTCPEYVKGQVKPDRSLIIAGEAAALQWTFNPNFGIEPRGNLRFDYVQDVLVFNFVLDDSSHPSKE